MRVPLAAFLALAACAAPAPPPAPVPLLTELPDRPHEVLGRVEARGMPGANVRFVYEDLRRKAGAMDADAVVELERRKLYDPAEPGYFPSYGFDVRSGGAYYILEGLAIRYSE
jgi:hypothetical protein